MGVLRAGRKFAASYAQTRPTAKIPKNVRQAFHIAEAYESGIFKVEAGQGRRVYDCCYIFSDINYINLEFEDRKRILETLMKLLNSMSASFKITAANQWCDMDLYIKSLVANVNKGRYPLIAEGVRQWIDEKRKEGNIQNLEKVLFLTVTCKAADIGEAETYFKTMEPILQGWFEALGSFAFRLTGEERICHLRNFFSHDSDYVTTGGAREGHGHGVKSLRKNPLMAFRPSFRGGRDALQDALPASLKERFNFLDAAGRHISVLFARSFASSLDESRAVYGLTSLNMPLLVTVDCAPVKQDVLKGKLIEAHINNEAAISREIDDRRKHGQDYAGVSYYKEKRKDELESYQDQVDENDEGGFLVGFLVAVTADGEDELARRIDAVIEAARDNGITLDIMRNVQSKALNTALPIGARLVRHRRAFLSSSLVALQPFFGQDLIEPTGQFYGLNETTKHPVIADRKNLKSPHGMIVGHTGGGKSFHIKEVEVAQTLVGTDDDITIIDPQNEMEAVCPQLGGQFIDLAPSSGHYINPLEMSEETFSASEAERSRYIADQTAWATSFCEAVMSNITFTQEHRSAIGRCVRTMYADAFAQKKLAWQPTLRDFRDRYIADEMEKSGNADDRATLRRIYNSLEEYTAGAHDMFSRPSNLDLKSRLVIFGLHKVDTDMWEAVMITIMHFLANRMEYNQKLRRATRLIIDETQVVCSHQSSADMLLKAVVTYRKFGGICTMALQNLTRALENPELRDMFSNCGYKCFLDQGGVDARQLAAIQELSPKEFAHLRQDAPGKAVMVWGKKVILLDSRMGKDNPLYRPFSTNFHEAAAESGAESAPGGTSGEAAGQGTIKERLMSLMSVASLTAAEAAAALGGGEDGMAAALDELEAEGRLAAEGEGASRVYRVRRGAESAP